MKRLLTRAIVTIALLTSGQAFGQLNLACDLLQLVSTVTGHTRVIVQFQSAPSALQLLNIQLLGGTSAPRTH